MDWYERKNQTRDDVILTLTKYLSDLKKDLRELKIAASNSNLSQDEIVGLNEWREDLDKKISATEQLLNILYPYPVISRCVL